MPLIWRYLLLNFFKTFFLSLLTFVLVLITLRLDEIAHFSTLGPEGVVIFKYVLYQIPYILPIALPISCLISALLLMQRMSENHELIAMRSFRMSIFSCLTPILMGAMFLTVINFWIVSELATTCHLESTRLKAELRLVNPLLLMNHKHLMKMKGLYFDSIGPSKLGESAEDALFAYREKHSGKIALLIAKKLSNKDDLFIGDNVTLIGSIHMKKEDAHLAVENIKEYSIPINDFALFLENKTWKVNWDYLKLPLLLIQREEEKRALSEYTARTSDVKAKERSLNRIDLEIVRRISVGLAAFTFTFLGLGFGMHITRGHKMGSILKVVLLAALFLVSYFTAKGVDHLFLPAFILYTLPHIFIILFSFRAIYRLERGVV